MRFLSETGGGIIAGFQGKDLVLVEDEDGFQIPTPRSEVVVIDTDDYNIAKVVAPKLNPQKKAPVEQPEEEPADRPVTSGQPSRSAAGATCSASILPSCPST